MFYPDGSWYEGEWLDDFKHGFGKFCTEDREIIECEWNRDTPLIT